ncbi:MAG: dockerin type I repeat-containing protein [Thermodesulfobacteriota bacterium]|nr:dockerin type I repeat-containing protein [Thermodesulfobacteriota bacterium]
MKKKNGIRCLFFIALGLLTVVSTMASRGDASASELLPATSVALDDGKIAWGSEAGVYYWDGASYIQITGRSLADGFSPAAGFFATSDYSPTTSVSLDAGKVAWGSASGVYYWDGAVYTQVSGYTETTGFFPAPGFIAASDYSPTTSVSLEAGEVAWGSASGVYYWDGAVCTQVSGYTETTGFFPAPGFIAASDYSPTTSVSLEAGEVAWGSASGVYYWDGASFTQIGGHDFTDGFLPAPGFIAMSEYSPTTSVSLEAAEIGWGSASGVYHWDGTAYTQISGYTETDGFSPAPGFIAASEYAAPLSVSLNDGKVAWGSESGVYLWDGGSDTPYTQIGGAGLTTGFSAAPGFIAESEFSTPTSVSSDDGKIAWGSASGVYYWGGASVAEVSDLDDVKKGDVNGDDKVDIADAVLAFKILAGMQPPVTVSREADVNGDSRIGLEEILYIIEKIAGLRQ